MDHASHLVDLVDETGMVAGTKPRQEINKETDLYHTVFVQLRTPDDKLVLSRIPARTDLPNLYAGLLGITVATIRRHGETADEASKRAIKNELYLENVPLNKIGETYLILPDGHRKYMTLYIGSHPVPEDFSRTDLESLHAFSRSELDAAISSDKSQFGLPFLAIWQAYGGQLLPQ
jgi:hypothetical protein